MRWAVILRSKVGVLAGAVLSLLLCPTAVASETFKASVDSHLILVPVTVTDRDGRPILDLEAADFRVFDESQPGTVLSLSREEAPASLGIVLDVSGSMARKLPHALSAVRAVTKALDPKDEAALLTFA